MPTPLPLALLYCGGRTAKLKNQEALEKWFHSFIELHMALPGVPIFISGKVHLETGDEEYIARLARRIKRDWNKYSGFVVTLPHNHFLYWANMLRLMVGEVGKPIVCTTIMPEEEQQTASFYDVSLKASIVNSMQAATAPFGGVVTCVSPELLFVETVSMQKKKGEEGYIVEGKSVGRLDFGVQLTHDALPYDVKKRPEQLDVKYLDRVYRVSQREPEIRLPRKANGCIVYIKKESVASQLSLPSKVPTLVVSPEVTKVVSDGQEITIAALVPRETAAARFAFFCATHKHVGTALAECIEYIAQPRI